MKEEFYLYIFTLIDMGYITSYIFYNMVKSGLKREMTNLLIDTMKYDIVSIVSGVAVRKIVCIKERDIWLDKANILKLKRCEYLESVAMGMPIQCIPSITEIESTTSIVILYRPKSRKQKSPCKKTTHNPLVFGVSNNHKYQHRDIENEISRMVNDAQGYHDLPSYNEGLMLLDFTTNISKKEYYMDLIRKWVDWINSGTLDEFGNLGVYTDISPYDYISISTI